MHYSLKMLLLINFCYLECSKPNLKDGICIPIKKCPPLVDKINSKAKELEQLISQLSCDPDEKNLKNAKVCCPMNGTIEESIISGRTPNTEGKYDILDKIVTSSLGDDIFIYIFFFETINSCNLTSNLLCYTISLFLKRILPFQSYSDVEIFFLLMFITYARDRNIN